MLKGITHHPRYRLTFKPAVGEGFNSFWACHLIMDGQQRFLMGHTQCSTETVISEIGPKTLRRMKLKQEKRLKAKAQKEALDRKEKELQEKKLLRRK